MALLGQDLIATALAETGLPYEIVDGKKHRHIRIDGNLVCVLPYGSKGSRDMRQILNVRGRIRRAAKAIKEGNYDETRHR